MEFNFFLRKRFFPSDLVRVVYYIKYTEKNVMLLFIFYKLRLVVCFILNPNFKFIPALKLCF